MNKKIAALLTVVFLALVYIFLLVVLPIMSEAVERTSKSVSENFTNVTGNISGFLEVGLPIETTPLTFDSMPKVYLVLPGLIGSAILVMIVLSPAKELKDHPGNKDKEHKADSKGNAV